MISPRGCVRASWVIFIFSSLTSFLFSPSAPPFYFDLPWGPVWEFELSTQSCARQMKLGRLLGWRASCSSRRCFTMIALNLLIAADGLARRDVAFRWGAHAVKIWLCHFSGVIPKPRFAKPADSILSFSSLYTDTCSWPPPRPTAHAASSRSSPVGFGLGTESMPAAVFTAFTVFVAVASFAL